MLQIPLVSFRNVTKRFGNQVVLSNISIDIWPHQLTFVMGPSGVGKTVFLRLALGFDVPDSGSILLAGVDLATLDSATLRRLHQKHIYVFQQPALLDFLSVIENVCFPYLEHHPDANPNEVFATGETMLKNLGYCASVSKHPSHCTLGEAKLISTARALMLKPTAIFFDEPTTGLDEDTRTQMDHLILQLQRSKQCSCMVVSHDARSAMTTADRILYLFQTQFYADTESPQELLTHPDNHVRKFFGEGQVL